MGWVYQLACEVGDLVWELVSSWDSFPKWTIDKQLVEAADSIGANIVEANGRCFYGEKRKSLSSKGKPFDILNPKPSGQTPPYGAFSHFSLTKVDFTMGIKGAITVLLSPKG